MKSHVQIKLFAGLQQFTPPSSDSNRIEPGIKISNLLEQLNIPKEKAKLVFINGIIAEHSTTLNGGERIGIFPPVGGG
jgi:molybdopterin converting factor small subunit